MKKNIIKIIIAILILSIAYIIFVFSKQKKEELTFNKGDKFIYTFTYTTSNSSLLQKPGKKEEFSGIVSSFMKLNGDFILKCYKKTNKDYLLSGTFKNLKNSSITFNNFPIFKHAEALKAFLENKEFFFKMNKTGEIHDIKFESSSHPLYRNTAKIILSEMKFSLKKKEKSWNKEEKTNYGTALYKYTKHSQSNKTIITKTLKKYLTLSSLGVLDDLSNIKENSLAKSTYNLKSGILTKIEGQEKTTFQNNQKLNLFKLTTNFSLKLKSQTKFNPQKSLFLKRLSKMITEKIGESSITKKAKTSLLKQQSRNMSKAEMFNTLKIFGRTGKIFNKSLFLWRGVGFLRMHPEICKELISLFKDKSIKQEGKLLIVGLLTSTGIPQAQDALLAILDTQEAKNSSMYPIFYQHLTLLKNPTKETVEKIKSVYEESKTTGKFQPPAALTFGATAYNLKHSGKTKEAQEINDEMLSDLASSQDDKTRELMLDAIGNAGFKENFDTIKQYTQDNYSASTRATAISALRKNQTEESTDLLLQMTKEKEPLVKKEAMNTLQQYNLSAEDIEKLSENVNSGELKGSQYLDLLNLVAKYTNKYPTQTSNLLSTMLSKGINDPQIKLRAKNMLDQILKKQQEEN